MSALKISAADSNDFAINLIDEIERGLEPYRLRQFVRTLIASKSQSFATTHSAVAITCALDAQLWYLDADGSIGMLDRTKIRRQQERDPETFLSRVSVIAEGETEVGFVDEVLTSLFRSDPLDAGVRVCLGQGDDQMLPLLEALSASGLKFTGFADNDGKSPKRWSTLAEAMSSRLFRWNKGCIESNIIEILPDEYLENLCKNHDGSWSGERLRTLELRLDAADKNYPTLVAKADEKGLEIRDIIIAAATGNAAEISDSHQKKQWKKHAGRWFKKQDGSGGRELLDHLRAAGKWDDLEPSLRPFFNSVLQLSGKPVVTKIVL